MQVICLEPAPATLRSRCTPEDRRLRSVEGGDTVVAVAAGGYVFVGYGWWTMAVTCEKKLTQNSFSGSCQRWQVYERHVASQPQGERE